MQTEMDMIYCGKKIVDKGHQYINNNLKKYDITFSQFIIMMYIYNNSNTVTTVKTLSKCFELSHVTVIGILNRMEKSGFITTMKNPDDRRSRIVLMKEKGMELCKKISVPNNTLEENIIKILGEEKYKLFQSILYDIYINFDKIFVADY